MAVNILRLASSSDIYQKNGQLIYPCEELAKIGVIFHGWFARFFHQTIAVKVNAIGKDTFQPNRTYYIDRDNLKNYIAALQNDFDLELATDEDLVNTFNRHQWQIRHLDTPNQQFAVVQNAMTLSPILP